MPEMLKLAELIGGHTAIPHHRPCPKVDVDVEGWQTAIEQLSISNWTLLGLWGETNAVNMALLEEATCDIAVVTLPCAAGHFPSVAKQHLPAMRLERSIRDLNGLEPDGLPDTRPWFDHGRWGVRHPLGDSTASTPPEQYVFLPAEGESLHQIAVGPVHAGIIEPGHFRFTANGEVIVRLEARLGYVHKGV